MKRDPRISRALATGVGLTLTLALVFWAYNLGKSHSTAPSNAPQPRAVAAFIDPAIASNSAAAPSTAPTGLATSQPSTPLLAASTQRSADDAKLAVSRQNAGAGGANVAPGGI